jgi:hypothetical protein
MCEGKCLELSGNAEKSRDIQISRKYKEDCYI